MERRQRGRVKWFNHEKGYGFISRPNGKDVFVHFTMINSSGYRKLLEGQLVEFEEIVGERGPSAKNVFPVDDYYR